MKHYLTPKNEIMAIDEDQEDLIQDSWTLIEEDQLATKMAEKLEGEFSLLSYAEKRFSEYPSIVDQLDTIYHLGIDVWKAEIAIVKNKYPKPTGIDAATDEGL